MTMRPLFDKALAALVKGSQLTPNRQESPETVEIPEDLALPCRALRTFCLLLNVFNLHDGVRRLPPPLL